MQLTLTLAEQVACADCQHYIPNKHGHNGIGACQALIDFKTMLDDKGLALDKYRMQVELFETKLGIMPVKAREPVKLLYPDIRRWCEEHKANN